MWGKAFASRAVASLSQLVVIALNCGVRIPFTIGLPDAADIACIYSYYSYQIIFILLCVESLAGYGYTECSVE